MSRTNKLSLTAVIAALCVVCLGAAAVLPRVTLSLAALAGLFPAVTVMVCGYGWAAAGSAVAVLLALLLLPDKTASVWFACFFGHYPIWKGLIEGLQAKHGSPWLGWCLKLSGFGACMLLLFFLFGKLFAAALAWNFIDSSTTGWLLVGVLSAAFVAYDIAFSILIEYFRAKLLPRLP